MSESIEFAIVGAGMAGLTAAAMLRQNRRRVVLLDKGRGVGGRLATRRAGESRFDHGAQFFTVRDARFRAAVDQWRAAGWVTEWFTETGHTRYRGTGGMNGLAKELAKPFDVRTQTAVTRIEAADGGWLLVTGAGDEIHAGNLLMTAPVPQSLALLAGCLAALAPDVFEDLRGIDYDPCFALLATVEGPGLVPAPGYVRPETGPIAFLADNTRKGVSTGPAALTIHASPGFTRDYFDAPHEEIARLLLEAAAPWLGGAVTAWQVHRWKFSQPITPVSAAFLYSATPAPIAFAGDAFGGPRVEGAFLSGLSAAEAFLALH